MKYSKAHLEYNTPVQFTQVGYGHVNIYIFSYLIFNFFFSSRRWRIIITHYSSVAIYDARALLKVNDWFFSRHRRHRRYHWMYKIITILLNFVYYFIFIVRHTAAITFDNTVISLLNLIIFTVCATFLRRR